MRIKEVTAMPFAKVKSVTPSGTDPSKSVVVLTTPDGKEIQTTQDNLIPGAQPNTFQLKPTAMVNAQDGLKPGDTITSSPTQGSTTMGEPTTSTEIKTSEEQTIGGDATDDFINDVEIRDKNRVTKLSQIKRLAGL